MTSDDIAASLQAPSAKIWPREQDGYDWLFVRQELAIPRWEANEAHAPKRDMWRNTPKGEYLEVKGALLGPDLTEYVPKGKRNRSCQIHEFGYT
jgi:hypothetical protein